MQLASALLIRARDSTISRYSNNSVHMKYSTVRTVLDKQLYDSCDSSSPIFYSHKIHM